MGTKATPVMDMDLTGLAEQALEEVYEGAPDRFSDPGPESPVIEHLAVDNAPNVDDQEDRVLLVNIKFTEEKVFIPDGNVWSGRTVQFTNGRFIADRDTANRVLASCPHVHEEPKSGEWFVHDESGFRTRIPAVFVQYTQQYADNR